MWRPVGTFVSGRADGRPSAGDDSAGGRVPSPGRACRRAARASHRRKPGSPRPRRRSRVPRRASALRALNATAAQAQLDLALDQYRRQFARSSATRSCRRWSSARLRRRSPKPEPKWPRRTRASLKRRASFARPARASARPRPSARRRSPRPTRPRPACRARAAQLASTRVVAPFSGVVEARLQETGELAAPGQPVVRLVGSGSVKVTAGVPERYAGPRSSRARRCRSRPNAYAVEAARGAVCRSSAPPSIRTPARSPSRCPSRTPTGSLKPSMVVRLNVTRGRARQRDRGADRGHRP